MEAVSGEGRMLSFYEARKRYFPDEEQPLSLLLSRKIPIYLKVDQVRYKVYRSFKGYVLSPSGSPGDAALGDLENSSANALGFDMHGFSDDLLYLRLDDSSLEELGHSGLCESPQFCEFGLSIDQDNRPRVRGQRKSPRVISRIHDLKREEFYEAFLIDREAWGNGKAPSLLMDSEFRRYYLPEGMKLHKKDLFLDVKDVSGINQFLKAVDGLPDFPYEFGSKMPGIYWMFQAACQFNASGSSLELNEEQVVDWLKRRCGKGPFFTSSGLETAFKFIRMDVNRFQGGPQRDPIDLDDIKGFRAHREHYEFPFASEGLSMILAIADWWSGRGEGDDAMIIDLAKKFVLNGFAGLEVGDLVRLISGSAVTERQNKILREWMEATGRKPRNFGSFRKPHSS